MRQLLAGVKIGLLRADQRGIRILIMHGIHQAILDLALPDLLCRSCKIDRSLMGIRGCGGRICRIVRNQIHITHLEFFQRQWDVNVKFSILRRQFLPQGHGSTELHAALYRTGTLHFCNDLVTNL